MGHLGRQYRGSNFRGGIPNTLYQKIHGLHHLLEALIGAMSGCQCQYSHPGLAPIRPHLLVGLLRPRMGSHLMGQVPLMILLAQMDLPETYRETSLLASVTSGAPAATECQFKVLGQTASVNAQEIKAKVELVLS
jgi:hypothetical protein